MAYQTKPTTKSYLSYPPKEWAKINRASRQYEPFFYCATSRQVPFFELGLNKGDKIVLSKWRTTKPLLLNNIGYTEINFKELNSNRENQKWNKNENSLTLTEENIIIQNYLAKTFSQHIPKDKTDLYKLTIAIAEKHYSEDEEINVKFQGLLYPTIPMKANADNIALRPTFIHEGGLEFLEVEWIEVTKSYDFKFDVEVLDWANSLSDTDVIEWKGRLPQWTFFEGEEFFFTVEDGKQVARNKDGEIIEPH